jgi:hypothetical protein
MVIGAELVALAFCPAPVAAAALVSVPLVVALGAVAPVSEPLVAALGAVVLVSVPLVVALGAELELDGELDMDDEASPAVPDGMLSLGLLGEALAPGCVLDVDELDEVDCA